MKITENADDGRCKMTGHQVDEAEKERRILVHAMHATNADRAVDFGIGERGDLAGRMATDGLLGVDDYGTLPGHVYYTITDAGRVRLAELGGDC